jgi:hypothetical protein
VNSEVGAARQRISLRSIHPSRSLTADGSKGTTWGQFTGPIAAPRFGSSCGITCYTEIVRRQLTLMASSLHRYLGQRIGHGCETVKSRRLFRDSIDAMARIEIGARAFSVHLQKRAYSPLLVAAGFDKIDIRSRRSEDCYGH